MTHDPVGLEVSLAPEANEADIATAAALAGRAFEVVGRHHRPMWLVMGPGTSDHPGLYLARLWVSLPQPIAWPVLLRAPTLEMLRAALAPLGLMRVSESENSDPNVLEVWL